MVSPSKRFRNNSVNDSLFKKVFSGQLQRLSRLFLELPASPENRGTAFGRNNRIPCIFSHHDPIPYSYAYGPSACPLTYDNANNRHAEPRHLKKVTGNRLGLPLLLSLYAGICTGSVDQGDNRLVEFFRKLHQAQSFAISFGLSHTKISVQV